MISTSEKDAGCGRGRIFLSPRKWLSAATGTLDVSPLHRTVLLSKQFNVDFVREISRRLRVENDAMRVLVRHFCRHVGNLWLTAKHVR